MNPFDKLEHNIHDQEEEVETSDNVIPEVPISEGHPLEPPLDPGGLQPEQPGRHTTDQDPDYEALRQYFL